MSLPSYTIEKYNEYILLNVRLIYYQTAKYYFFVVLDIPQFIFRNFLHAQTC